MRAIEIQSNEDRTIQKARRLTWAMSGVVALLTTLEAASGQFYQQTNLVSDVAGLAMAKDTNLIGAWGITASPTSPWWVNSTVGGRSLIINGAGQPQSLVVTIPPTNGATATAIVFNGGLGFQVSTGEPAVFLFATLNGVLSGWNPGQSNRTVAKVVVNNAGKAGYTGLTIAQSGGKDFLYAANYFGDRIEVFDTNFNAVAVTNGAFEDGRVPGGFSVFNIQLISSNHLYVTYAPTNALGGPAIPGNGFVDVYSPEGELLHRLRHGPWMNSPWGVTVAPGDFGRFSHKLLVGMFGSGNIAAFDLRRGHFRGVLRGTDEAPLTLSQGLWGLGFGNGASAGPTNVLYFAQDIVNTNGFHGLFGAIMTAPGGPDNDGDRDDQMGQDQDDDDEGQDHP